jgi:hypothetical protein
MAQKEEKKCLFYHTFVVSKVSETVSNVYEREKPEIHIETYYPVRNSEFISI